MRLWDIRRGVHSIPRLAHLLRGAQLVAKLVERERQATHDTRRGEMSLGEGEKKLPVRSTPDQRERVLMTKLSSWLEKVDATKDCAEIGRLRNYRRDILAHSAARSHRPQIPMPHYGEEQKLLELTIPVVSEGFRLPPGLIMISR
jgi:hypothetical protein